MCLPPGDCVTLSREMPVTMSRIVAWQRPDVVPPVSWPLLTLRASLSSGLSGSNSRAALPAFSLSLGHNSRSDTLQPHYIASLILHNSRTGQMGKQSESSIATMWFYTINEVLLIIRTLNLVLVNWSLLWSLTTKLFKGSQRSRMFVMTAPDTDLGQWSVPPSLSPVIIIPVVPGPGSRYCLPSAYLHQSPGSPALIVFPQPETEKRRFEQREAHDVILRSKSWGHVSVLLVLWRRFVASLCGQDWQEASNLPDRDTMPPGHQRLIIMDLWSQQFFRPFKMLSCCLL